MLSYCSKRRISRVLANCNTVDRHVEMHAMSFVTNSIDEAPGCICACICDH